MATAPAMPSNFKLTGLKPAEQTNGVADTDMAGVGSIENGTRSHFNDLEYIFYHGCWVRYYEPLVESLASKKLLIDHLTRRTFHHTEPGINTPGYRLDAARSAYESQTDSDMKRVNAAMLAGALFNRATDLFTSIVELEEKGVKVSRDNELMRSCGRCFEEALELGRDVKHHSGEEGIDEVWGEPFRAFTTTIADYYESRFIKVAQTMNNIDLLGNTIKQTFCNRPEFSDLAALMDTYADAAKHECETMKSDSTIFDIWPRFIATGEQLANFQPAINANGSREYHYAIEHAMQALVAGRDLINWVARARVPMPKSTELYIARCAALTDRLAVC